MLKIYPGEILREEFLVPLGVSANSLAFALGIPSTRIFEIVHERRGISADTAARLARYFGTSAQMWLNLQNRYELALVEELSGDQLNRIVPRQPLATLAWKLLNFC